MTVQVNVKLDEKIASQVDQMVKKGYVKSKKEAFEKGIQMLLKVQKGAELEDAIAEIRRGTRKTPSSVTAAAIKAHEEEG
jgi:Arc/MetJ-type ribon-helix-helix transcriptional regulator